MEDSKKKGKGKTQDKEAGKTISKPRNLGKGLDALIPEMIRACERGLIPRSRMSPRNCSICSVVAFSTGVSPR